MTKNRQQAEPNYLKRRVKLFFNPIRKVLRTLLDFAWRTYPKMMHRVYHQPAVRLVLSIFGEYRHLRVTPSPNRRGFFSKKLARSVEKHTAKSKYYGDLGVRKDGL